MLSYYMAKYLIKCIWIEKNLIFPEYLICCIATFLVCIVSIFVLMVDLLIFPIEIISVILYKKKIKKGD